MTPVTLVIADDHPIASEGLASLLGRDDRFRLLGRAANGIEAIALIKTAQPDCAVLDMSMPGANGLEVFLEARRWSPRTRFTILTGHDAPARFRSLIQAGINGILMKNTDPVTLCQALSDIAAGQRILCPEAREARDATEENPQLTAREMEVLEGLARGLTNLGLSEVLGISPKTIDTHRTSLMRKMKARSIAVLLVKAMRQGLI